MACGLSGGADSTALVALARAAGLQVTAWHVNHGLHSAAEVHARAAHEIAERFGAGFELRRVQLEAGPDLEARARSARYAALPDDVLVGHTADDRAETVLFNVGRGGGLAGAAAPHRSVGRPLLGLRRFETRALCRQLGVATVHDPMNDDPSFARVVIRNEVMPALARALNRDPVPLLNRHADLASQALETIAELAESVDPTNAAELSAAAPAVASQALRSWISETVGAVPSAACIDRVLDVAAGRIIATEISGGHRVARTAQRLRIEPRSAPHRAGPRSDQSSVPRSGL
ncbi:MAG: tRNA lysidine(34) synthetase TilS [Acidimicrobiaceae bacterium]|nr:tRNA lysidine(34) synthetase TilS [Acidimicrobiaceae bacterium]MCY4280562.1 tRNA lysidine(34) synthetase TilS [Acidimicrobiaceae bacterium]MCY4293370.1 tRNA lysidine(34) synthetase TilS [Acidimicrobiaceae bacterium]